MIRAIRLLPILFGSFLVASPFYRPLLFTDRALLFRDLTRDFLPNKILWAKSVSSGEGIPFWNHFIHGGTPFYAVNTTSPLHPLNFLFLLTNPAKAALYFLFAHYLLLFFGFYFLARAFKLERWQASALGAAFPLSGLMISAHSLPHYLASSASIPFWLLGMHELYKRKNFQLWLVGAAIGWPIIAGDPQFAYIMAIATLGYMALHRNGQTLLQGIFVYAQVGVSAVLFSGIQLFPTLGFLLGSNRLQIQMDEVLSFSLHPYRIIEAVVPLAFGNRFGANSAFLGENLVNFIYKNPFIFSIYPGFFLLILAGFVPWRDRKQSLLLGGAIATLCLCFGSFFNPSLYEVVAHILPGFQMFRYPERLIFWVLLLLWLAGARSLAILPAQKPLSNWPWKFLFPAAQIALGLGVLIVYRFGYLGTTPQWHFGAAGTFCLALIWIGLIWRQARWGKNFFLFFGFVSLFADALLTGQRLVWDQSINTLDIRRYSLAQAIVKDLSHLGPNGQARRLSSLFSGQHPFWKGSLDYSTSTTNFSLEALLPNTSMIFGIEEVTGYLSLQDSNREQFFTNTVLRELGNADPRFLNDLMAVRYVPQVTPDGTVKLSINTTAQPYIFFPPKIHFAKDVSAAVSLMRSTDFRSNKDLVLVGPAERKPEISPEDTGDFEILKRNGREITIKVKRKLDLQRYLLLNESFNANWVAEMNLKPLPIERGNQWAMSVLLPASSEEFQTVTFRYQDPMIPLGQTLSALWILIGLGLWLASRRTKETA